jgi:hypothetical protein
MLSAPDQWQGHFHMRALARQFAKYPFLTAATLVALLLVLEIFLFPIYIDTCQENDHYCDYYTTRENIAFVFIRIVAKFLDDHNGTVAAIATMAIAWFTWTLKKSTDRLWSATDKLWRAGEDQHAAVNRAFVFIDGFDHELTTAKDTNTDIEDLPEQYRDRPQLYITRLAIQPIWRNGGVTPTKEMTINTDMRGPGFLNEIEYNYRFPARNFFLAPIATVRGDVIEIPGARVPVDFGLQFQEIPPILIWGRADYNDIFGKPHFIEWSYALRLSAPNNELRVGFIQRIEHNRSD